MSEPTSGTVTPRRAQKFIMLATAGAFLDGFDLVIISIAILMLTRTFHLTPLAVGLTVAATFAGMVVGATVFGSVADKVGRRKVFIADMILFVVAALVTGLAPNIALVAVGRVLTGIAIGMDYPAATAVIVELASTSRKGGYGMIMQAAQFCGDLVAVTVGLLLYTFGGPDAWRWMFLAAMVPAVAVFLLRKGTPESPFWSARKAQTIDAPGIPDRRAGRWRDLFHPRYRRRTLFIAGYWFLGNVIGSSLLLYAPTLASTAFRLTGSSALLFTTGLYFLYALANILIAVFVIDRVTRRRLTLASWLVSLVGTILLVVVLDVNVWLTLALFAVATASLQAGIMGPAFPWSAELFPTRLRATGQGAATSGGKLGSLVGTLTLPSLLAAYGIGGVFGGVVVGLALGLILTFTLGMETSRLGLDEIDRDDDLDEGRRHIHAPDSPRPERKLA